MFKNNSTFFVWFIIVTYVFLETFKSIKVEWRPDQVINFQKVEMKDPLERNISETIDFDSVIFDNILMLKKDLTRTAWKDIAELSLMRNRFLT